MNRRGVGAAGTLACLLLAGCRHKAAVVAAPLPPRPVMISVPPPTHRAEPAEPIALQALDPPALQVPRKPLPRFHPLRATRAQLAGLNVKPAPPVDLGQLTAGGDAGTGALRQQTEELMRSQQRRLAALSAQVSLSHPQQMQQVRLFLQQADEAWKKLDVEGARTLATKAKVLLDELQA